MRQPEHPPAVRVQAANILLDRGWGKPSQTHTGEDDEGKVTVIIRHLVESRDEARDAKIIDASPVPHENADTTPKSLGQALGAGKATCTHLLWATATWVGAWVNAPENDFHQVNQLS
jgi:hypothetical protein